MRDQNTFQAQATGRSVPFAQRPELVPDVAFVDIPQHMEILKDVQL